MSEKRYYYVTPDDYETAEKNGIDKLLVYQRVNNGWDVDRAITEPVNTWCLHNGIWDQWKDKAVVCYKTFASRLNRGMTPKEAATTPKISRAEVGKRQRRYTDEQLARAEANGLKKHNLSYRINVLKWDIERAINTPKMTKAECGRMRSKKGMVSQ